MVSYITRSLNNASLDSDYVPIARGYRIGIIADKGTDDRFRYSAVFFTTCRKRFDVPPAKRLRPLAATQKIDDYLITAIALQTTNSLA